MAQWLSVRTKYHSGFIEDIKALPRDHRMWNPESKVWLVDAGYEGHIRRLAERHNIKVGIENLTFGGSDEPVDTSDLDDLTGIPISLAMRLLEAQIAKAAKATREDRN